MTKNRLEAFSDGVLAIIITIMVLEIKIPHEAHWATLFSLGPKFLSYVLSFIYVGIYWNNHHHLFHSVHRINGSTMWANLYLLFWLSLFPFATGWMGENHFESPAVAFYGIILTMAGLAYYLLVNALTGLHGQESLVSQALGKKTKERVSLILYLVSIPVSFWQPLWSLTFYILVALIWLCPDRRIEKRINAAHEGA